VKTQKQLLHSYAFKSGEEVARLYLARVSTTKHTISGDKK